MLTLDVRLLFFSGRCGIWLWSETLRRRQLWHLRAMQLHLKIYLRSCCSCMLGRRI